jgi:uncharacterized Zn-finger protein
MSSKPSLMKEHACTYLGCAKVFDRRQKLLDHYNLHTNSRPYKCMMCDKAYSRNGHLTVHMKLHFPPEFSCGRCGYACHTRDRLHKHRRTCMIYECAICAKTYVRKAWYDAHVTSHHFKMCKRRKAECRYCKFEFSNRKNLLVHERSFHELMKPFLCRCGKNYAHQKSLDEHARKCVS